MTIHEKIIKIMYETLEVNESQVCEKELMEYEIDSLSFMRIIVDIEEEFGAEISDDLLIYSGKETLQRIEKLLCTAAGESSYEK